MTEAVAPLSERIHEQQLEIFRLTAANAQNIEILALRAERDGANTERDEAIEARFDARIALNEVEVQRDNAIGLYNRTQGVRWAGDCSSLRRERPVDALINQMQGDELGGSRASRRTRSLSFDGTRSRRSTRSFSSHTIIINE